VRRTRRGLVGGIARMGAVFSGSPTAAAQEARDAIAQTRGRRFIVAPGCVLPTTVPDENLMALRRAVDS
jgi:uroporphyrinogen decarboxylase